MGVYNEYSKLKTILIGKLLPIEYLVEITSPSDDKMLPTIIKIHEETNEDLDNLQKFFEEKGVKVYRPNIDKYYDEIKAKTKSVPPSPSTIRDWCFSYGDSIIISKTHLPNRWFEWLYWKDVFDELEEQGKTIHHMVSDDKFDFESFSNKSNLLLTQYENYSYTKILKDIKYKLSQAQNVNSEWDKLCKSYYSKFIQNLYLEKNSYIFKEEFRPHYLYSNSALQKYPLIHTSSFLKHNKKIISSPLGNRKGYRHFKKLLSNTDVEFCHILGEMGCITKSSNPINLDIILTDSNNRFSTDIVNFSTTGTPAFQSLIINNPRVGLTPARLNNHMNLTIEPNSNIDVYMKTLCSNHDSYNLEYNSITYEPYKIAGGIFGDSRDEFMYVQNIRAHNLGLRHQPTLKRDIRCYTLDIDREFY